MIYFYIPLTKDFNSPKGQKYQIPTQFSNQIEKVCSEPMKAQHLYWMIREAKRQIAATVKTALIQYKVEPIPSFAYPIKIEYDIFDARKDLKRFDVGNLMAIYRKVIPDVLTGSFDKFELEEKTNNFRKNYIIKYGIIEIPILADDSTFYMPNEGETRFWRVGNKKDETIKVTIKRDHRDSTKVIEAPKQSNTLLF